MRFPGWSVARLPVTGGCLLISRQFRQHRRARSSADSLETYVEKKRQGKNPRTDLAAGIKMQVVRACALLGRSDIGILWPTALCVPQ